MLQCFLIGLIWIIRRKVLNYPFNANVNYLMYSKYNFGGMNCVFVYTPVIKAEWDE